MTPVITPDLGMGATLHIGSDSYSYTVTRVISPTRILVRPDDVSGDTSYGARGNKEAVTYAISVRGDVEYTFRRNGVWGEKGKHGPWARPLHLGSRRAYCDPDF